MNSLNDSINNIKIVQNTTNGIHEVTKHQISLLPRVIFLDCKESSIEFGDKEITIIMKPYTGIKGFINKIRFKKKHKDWARLLVDHMEPWLPRNMRKKPIKIFWDRS